MQVMRCPKCQAVNGVQLESCRSCGTGLWPDPCSEREREHNLRVCVAEEEESDSLRDRATRFIRRLFGAGAST